jgi:hypothetical protein
MDESQVKSSIVHLIETLEKTRLTEQRWQLQREIVALRHLGADTDENSLLSIRKMAYNEAMDALRGLRRDARMDPMDKLPHEIWADIFLQIAVSGSSSLWYKIPRTEDIIPVTMVSKRWRAFALSEPRLWNVIALKSKRCNMAEGIAWQLSLSGNLPLTLEFTNPFDQWAEVRSELSKHRDRIESIALFGFPLQFRDSQSPQAVRQVLEDLAPLPNLRQIGHSFSDTGRWDDLANILDRFSSLRRLPYAPLTSQVLQDMKERPDLHEVRTCDSIYTISPVIAVIPGVKKVVFRSHFGGHREPEQSTWTEPESNRQLPRTGFTYDAYSTPLPVSFLHRLPLVTSLEITTSFVALKETVRILHNFSKLEHFRCSIAVHMGDILSPPDTISPNYSVQSLHVSIYYPSLNRVGEDLASKAVVIPEMIFNAVPSAKSIIYSTGEVPHALRFLSLDGLASVKELYMFFQGDLEPLTSTIDLPPQVEHISLSCQQTSISCIRSTSARKLHCSHEFLEPFNDQNISVLNSLNWPAIETANVDANMFDWKRSALHTLQGITLQERRAGDFIDSSITLFLRELACNPDSFPSLREITLDGYPEWDVLVIMLEHRNLLADPHIQRIEKVGIPIFTPIFICRTISNLLKSKWLPRPSNKELSLAGNAETILEPTM